MSWLSLITYQDIISSEAYYNSSLFNALLVPWWMHWVVMCFVADPQLPRISFCSARAAFSCLLLGSLPTFLPSISASPPSCPTPNPLWLPRGNSGSYTRVELQKLYKEIFSRIYFRFLSPAQLNHRDLFRSSSNLFKAGLDFPSSYPSVLHDLFLIVWISFKTGLLPPLSYFCLSCTIPFPIVWISAEGGLVLINWLQRMMTLQYFAFCGRSRPSSAGKTAPEIGQTWEIAR